MEGKMRRRRPMLLLLAGPVLVTACAVVADLGDRTLDGGSSAAQKTDAAPTATTTTTTTTTATAPPGPTPSYCTGIVLYASFDGKLTGDRGWSNAETLGPITTTPAAKFGGGASLSHDTNGGALFLLPDAAHPWPDDVGSLAVWYKQTPGTVWGSAGETAPVLYKPVAAVQGLPEPSAGLGFYLFFDGTATTGLFDLSGPGQQEILTVPQASTAPYVRANDFNHYFTAWNRTGAGPTALFAVNGGSGIEVASGTADPQPPDSGAEQLSGFKAFTSTPWASEGPAVALRLGGQPNNNSDGIYDDLVVWNRVLSFEEAAAVFAATTAVGAACHL
jgi:hypothetical protein